MESWSLIRHKAHGAIGLSQQLVYSSPMLEYDQFKLLPELSFHANGRKASMKPNGMPMGRSELLYGGHWSAIWADVCHYRQMLRSL